MASGEHRRGVRRWRALAWAVLAAGAGGGTFARAAPVAVIGAHSYSAAAGGYQAAKLSDVAFVNSAGLAAGWETFAAAGTYSGDRPVRWDASGAAAVELGTLGAFADGSTFGYVNALNGAGTAVGRSYFFGDANAYQGSRATRWGPAGTAPVQLGDLGTNASGSAFVEAYAINAAGTAVGTADRYNAAHVSLGSAAVRWDAAGTAAVELGNLGTSITGVAQGGASAINDAGTIVGSSTRYSAGGTSLGNRAVRWDAGATAAVELGHLWADAAGNSSASASLINNSGTAGGQETKYVNGAAEGPRAVRWDPSGAVTELGTLGTDATGTTTSYPLAIGRSGVMVGLATKYVADPQGAPHAIDRAVRWDAGGSTATELGALGFNATVPAVSLAIAVDDAGNAVGYASGFGPGGFPGANHAVLWPAGSTEAFDLNALLAPGSNWTLTAATSISPTGNWVAGYGDFDPDGAGGQAAYPRLFIAQVPEPVATCWLVAAAALATLRRSGRRRSATRPMLV